MRAAFSAVVVMLFFFHKLIIHQKAIFFLQMEVSSASISVVAKVTILKYDFDISKSKKHLMVILCPSKHNYKLRHFLK